MSSEVTQHAKAWATEANVVQALACTDTLKRGLRRCLINTLFHMLRSFILFFTILLISPSIVFGAAGLPEIIAGGTTVTDANGNIYYGGMTGNYAVLNHDPDSTYGFTRIADDYTFGLLNCYGGIPSLSTACFLLGTGLTGEGNAGRGKLMTSTTSIEDNNGVRQPLYQLPALYLGDVNIIGDVYSPDYSNFAFWGRNLAQNPSGNVPTGAGASWMANDYPIDGNVQANWNSAQTIAFREQKLPVLEGEATVFATKNYSQMILSLDYSSIDNNTATQRENEKYPEGKIWKLDADDPDDLSFESSSKTYYGKGTIIVPGNLTIKSGVDILPNPSGDGDRLGFIVLGDVTFEGNNDVKAAILCLGDMTVGNNVSLTGSFVAQNFATGANDSFIYDYAFDKDWPPGFRNLNMPHAAPGQ